MVPFCKVGPDSDQWKALAPVAAQDAIFLVIMTSARPCNAGACVGVPCIGNQIIGNF